MQRTESVGGGEDVSENTAWPPFHWVERPEIQPILEDFWRVKHDEHDLVMYNRFLEILRLSRGGLNGDEIGRRLHMNNVRKFLTGEKKSFLTHLRAEHDRIGRPRSEYMWIPLRIKPRGTPGEEWVQVPSRIRSLKDIGSVLAQLTPAKIPSDSMTTFGYSGTEELRRDRLILFGFFVGTTIGDAGKHRKGESKFLSKAISLVLSSAKPNSLRFGEFTCLCAASSLGLQMHRIGNATASKYRFTKADCYSWISPSSPLVSWVFHDCLGLTQGEKTTYHPVRMTWLTDALADFKTAVLQGITESDGWVDAANDTVCMVSSPNNNLLSTVLTSMGVRSRIDHQEKVDIIRVPTEDAAKLPVFSQRIHSVYFEQMQIMAKATRLPERTKLPADVINHIREIAARCDTLSAVCLELARRYGIKVSGRTVRKYV